MKKFKVSKVLVFLICIMVVIYTGATFALQYFTSVEISPTLTTAWFAFWGTELVALATIRNTKIKNNYNSENSEDSDEET